jgi:hypothetical protein
MPRSASLPKTAWPGRAPSRSPPRPASTRRCSTTTSRARKSSTPRRSRWSRRGCATARWPCSLREASPGERLLRAALNHFDRILTQREFQSLMQQEMMRLHKGEEGAAHSGKRIFAPLHAMFQSMVREGIASGELIEADWLQMCCRLGGNVFYFLSAPVWRLSCLLSRSTPRCCGREGWRWWSFWAKALFQDRKHGAELAAKVLADTPMPEITEFKDLR